MISSQSDKMIFFLVDVHHDIKKYWFDRSLRTVHEKGVATYER